LLEDLLYMVSLVQSMENYSANRKGQNFKYANEIFENIYYDRIDFGERRHRDTFLELDYVWGEYSSN